MTRERPEPPHLVVVGVDLSGAEVVRLPLGHGEDPVALLAGHGWGMLRALDVQSGSHAQHVLTMSFVVEAQPAARLERMVPPRRDDDVQPVAGEVPERYQRIAAYPYVTGSRVFLMTQFSSRTHAPGLRVRHDGGGGVVVVQSVGVVGGVWRDMRLV